MFDGENRSVVPTLLIANGIPGSTVTHRNLGTITANCKHHTNQKTKRQKPLVSQRLPSITASFALDASDIETPRRRARVIDGMIRALMGAVVSQSETTLVPEWTSRVRRDLPIDQQTLSFRLLFRRAVSTHENTLLLLMG